MLNHINSINASGFGKSVWNNLDVLIANNCFDLVMLLVSGRGDGIDEEFF